MKDNTNKENLRKLLNFLNDEIIHKPENRWFVDELQKILPQKPQATISQSPSTIAKIEKYLALDYRLDESNLALDYSFIKDEYLRECFEADCREMIRYRWGLRSHKIDFGEFCRYVLRQSERLLNMYYMTKGDITQIINFIKEKCNWAKIDECKSLEAISYTVKLYAYNEEFNRKETVYDVLDNVRKVRNTHSHGSVNDTDEIFFKSHYNQLVKCGYPLLPSCLVDWNTLKKNNVQLYNFYNNTIKNTPEHKRYIDLCWQRNLPFENITNALKLQIFDIKMKIQ